MTDHDLRAFASPEEVEIETKKLNLLKKVDMSPLKSLYTLKKE